jgi:hypothetical protein
MNVPIKFHAPALITLSGASGSGKTVFTDRLIRNADALFDQPVAGVMYCYTANQRAFETMARDIPGIVFYRGVPTVESVREWAGDDGAHRLLILDDLQTTALESKDVADIATIHSHHSNVSCVTVYQNLFGSGKYARTIALQAHYIVVMKNLRDQTQLSHLSRQIYPGKPQLLPNLMKAVTKRDKYPYILIDLSPHSDTDYRLRTNIFPGELTRVYALKS